jgi:membrane protein DedA with SNARE-associated domain
LLAPRRQARVQRLFARHGNRLMFVARFLPGLRTPIYLSAGMSGRVPISRFLVFDGLAALISVPFWVWLGYYGAENHDELLAWVARSKYVAVLGLLGLASVAITWVWRRVRRRDRLRASRALRRPRP